MSSQGKQNDKNKSKGSWSLFGKGKTNEEKKNVSIKKIEATKKEERPSPKPSQSSGKGNKSKSGQKSGNRQNRSGQMTRNSQIKSSDSALLQFGPIVSEFLSSSKLGKKKITAEYDHETNTWSKITFTFSTLNEGGISFGTSKSLEKDEYMAQRISLIGGPESGPRWLSYVASLFRIGIDITDTHPQVDIKKIFQFIKENMSPLEVTVSSLSQTEYDILDVKKLAPVLQSELVKFAGHYPNGNRILYIKGAINGSGTILKKIDWNNYPMAPYNKASVLKDFRVKNDIKDDVMTRLNVFSETLNNANLGEEEGGHSSASTDNI